MLEIVPVLKKVWNLEGVAVLALFVISNLNESTREEFLRVLRDQIARAQGRARFAAIRGLEERRRVNEQIFELLFEIERTIAAVLRGGVEDVVSISGLKDLVHTSVAEVEPPPGSLL